MSHYMFKIIFICGGLSSLLACQGEKSSTERLARIAKVSKEGDVQIDFFGKVVDQFGNPVEGVELRIGINQFGLNPSHFFRRIKDIYVKTNAQGCFSIQNERGTNLFVELKPKNGYEYSLQDPLNVLSSKHEDPPLLFAPDPKNPVIYHLRKKGEIALLLEHGVNFQFPVKESGKEMGMDLIQGASLDAVKLKTLIFNGDPVACDLKAKAIYSPKRNTWSVVLSPGDPNGGIIVSNQLLYEAPKEGYKPNYTFTPTSVRGRGNDMYLYLRSREPFLYSRIKFNDNFHTSPDYFAFGGEAVTNPYGERVLDQATDLPFEVRHSLEEEVRESFRHKNRPPKPNLQKLVQEAEKKKPQSQPLFKR